MQSSIDTGFSTFFIVWIVLGIAASAFFYISEDTALKRKVFPILVVGACILFGSFVWGRRDASEPFNWIMLAVLVLIAFINIKSIKFCDSCSKMSRNRNPFSSMEYCSKCGSKFAE